MSDSFFFAVAHNAALLLAIAFLFDTAAGRLRTGRTRVEQALAGAALGVLAVVVMLSPWTFGPGIFFDAGSVLFGISGLFFGTLPTVVATAMAAVLRLYLGGASAWTGIAVIVASGTIGILWGRCRRRPPEEISRRELFLFGVVVHIVMLLMMITLPWKTALQVLSNFAAPVMLILPLGTVLLGVLVANRFKREQSQQLSRESEDRYRSLFENSFDAVLLTSPDGGVHKANTEACRIFGRTEEEICRLGRGGLVDLSDPRLPKALEERARTGRFRGELNMLRADGSVFPVEMSSAVFTDREGHPRTVMVIRDITQRKQTDLELEESKGKYELLANNAHDWIYWVAPDGNTQYVSPSCERMTGFSPEEFMTNQHLVLNVVHPDDKDIFINRLGETGQENHETVRLEFRIVTKAGHLRWISHAGSPVYDREGRYSGRRVANRDITERKRQEDQLRRRLQRLTATREIDLAITGSINMHIMLSVFLDKVTTTLEVDAADVLLLDPYTHRLVYAAGRGFLTDALRHTDIPIGEGFAGQAALYRRLVSVPDLEREGSYLLGTSPLLTDEKFVAYYGIPLIAKGLVRGVLEIFNRTPILPDPEWMDFLEALAIQASIAIDNAYLFEDLQKSNLEIILSYDQTLEGWIRALDMRDKETEGHSRRVVEITMKISQKMDIPSSELLHVRRGALLHDFGKMGIPDSVLHKPGPLNDEEWKVMRLHPAKAHEMLSPIAYLKPALDIPFCHHEKWDGTGYPRGLKGEDIPLAARIFAVVDVWDALRSERPYRPAWPEEKALDHIRAQAGLHFDPKVVLVFLKFLDEGKRRNPT